MTLDALLHAIEDTSLATLIREDASLFPWVEGVHVLALTLVLGFIATVDLRLLGWASANRPVIQVSSTALPITWSAFIVAVLSGAWLFSSNAVGYGHNRFFQFKMLLLVLAGVNMLVLHLTAWRHADEWTSAARTARAGKIAGAVSLTLWVAIAVCGRWIGFTLGPAS